MPLSDELKARIMKNATDSVGKDWFQVTAEFEAEMLRMKSQAGMKPWECWSEKNKGRT